jgi:hypothetical protein
MEYGISPAGEGRRKFFRDLDIVYTGLGLGATGVVIASLFVPVALPVVAG